MTLRKIARWGEPILLARALPVADVGGVQDLIDDMLETLDDSGGRGLAAPQVYDGRRVVLARERGDLPVLILINPVLDLEGDADALDVEGCLSIPGMRGVVPRHARLAYRGQDRQGAAIKGRAGGMLARILQHEVDHLDGILYPWRLKTPSHMGYDAEMARVAGRIIEEEG